MNGSWAGAMGHTQWMPEVWLNTGVDYDKDGRISPFGKPDDAFAGTAQYLVGTLELKAKYSAKLVYEWANPSAEGSIRSAPTMESLIQADPVQTGSARHSPSPR